MSENCSKCGSSWDPTSNCDECWTCQNEETKQRISNLESENARLQSPVIRCSCCGGTLIWKRKADGFEIIHSCTSKYGNLVAVCAQIGIAPEKLVDEVEHLRRALKEIHETSVKLAFASTVTTMQKLNSKIGEIARKALGK